MTLLNDMKSFVYPATVFAHDGVNIVVQLPDFPECAAAGGTREEALSHAAAALDVAVQRRLAAHGTIPSPRELRVGEVGVALAPLTAARALLSSLEDADNDQAPASFARPEDVLARLRGKGLEMTLSWRVAAVG